MKKGGKNLNMSNRGQSILEIIVALAIFSLFGSSLISLIVGSFSTLSRAGEIYQASALADEAIEAARMIRDRDWYELNADNATVDESGGYWVFIPSTGELIWDKYTRTIDFYPVFRDVDFKAVSATTTGAILDEGSKKIRVRVAWPLDNGLTGAVERYAYITNWNYDEWSQTDWFGGIGQAEWSEINMYDSDDGNINVSMTGEATLAEVATSTYAASGYIISSAFDTGQTSNFNNISWQDTIPEGCPECVIKLQIKTAVTQNDLTSKGWFGPAGEDDFYLNASSTRLNVLHNGDRWIQYKASLEGNTTATPALKEVRIGYKNR